MNFEYKYLKYKKKYLKLKKQIGGNPFYFSVYVFTRKLLDTERKNRMVCLLGKLYGGTIEVVSKREESPMDGYYWGEAVKYINYKSINPEASYYEKLEFVTSFVITRVPEELKTQMNDSKLTEEEYKIKEQLKNYGLESFSMPILKSGTEPNFSRGWGFWSDGLALITLIENN